VVLHRAVRGYMGTPTTTGQAANGLLTLWLDGKQLSDIGDLWLRTTDSLKIQNLYLALYHHDGTHSVVGELIDNVVVSTQRVGCGSDATQPYPPPNLHQQQQPLSGYMNAPRAARIDDSAWGDAQCPAASRHTPRSALGRTYRHYRNAATPAGYVWRRGLRCQEWCVGRSIVPSRFRAVARCSMEFPRRRRSCQDCSGYRIAARQVVLACRARTGLSCARIWPN
jgi:hypothetical protein